MKEIVWTVETSSGNIKFKFPDIFTEIMSRVITNKKEEHSLFASALPAYLEEQGLLSTLTPSQYALIAFNLGYYYRVFLEKNKVNIEQN